MQTATPTATLPRPRRNPIVRLFTSIWFGILLMTLILIYSSIISAYAPARWALEMTEMQAFSHWLFVSLSGLFMLALISTTLFRTRWMSINAGSITAHIGLVLLLAGAMLYFGTKVEGHVLLQSPRLVIQRDGRPVGEIPAVVGTDWLRRLPDTNAIVHVRVLAVQPAGVQAVAAVRAELAFNRGAAHEFVLAADGTTQPADLGYEIGLLAFPPEQSFYLNEDVSLYVQNLQKQQEYVLPIAGLPIYNDRYLPDEEGVLTDSHGNEAPSKRVAPAIKLVGVTIPMGWFERWQIPIALDTRGLPFEATITGYVSDVVRMTPRQLPGGGQRNVPIVAAKGERRRDVSVRALSAIRLKLTGRDNYAGWSDVQWIAYSSYPHVDTRPLDVQLPDGSTWELVYAPTRRPLGAALTAKHLWVQMFPGEMGAESYHSDIRVKVGDAPPHDARVETNNTQSIGPYTLYQSGFAQDGWSYSVLGVGNRNGMLLMTIGWIVVTIGCLWAFYLKPYLLRRSRVRTAAAALGVVALALVLPGCKQQPPLPPSQPAVAVDQQVDWSQARLIAVQEGGRYKTLDSFAREAFYDIYGREHLPGLTPLGSLFEWLFNRAAYEHAPVVKVGNAGLRNELADVLPANERQPALASKYFTLQQASSPAFQMKLRQISTDTVKLRASNKVSRAVAYADRMEQFLAIVPQPGGDLVAQWYNPREIMGNLSDEQLAELGISRADLPEDARFVRPGLSSDQALSVVVDWTLLRAAWLKRDAAGVQKYVDQLAKVLPTLAAPGVYPSVSQRAAEAKYYAAGKFTYGWIFYFFAILASIFALVTGWRVPWFATIVLIAIGLTVHVYGISLRWYILGRIPVANMFEAVVASAAIGVIIVTIVELFLKTRILLVGAAALGFMALIIGQFVPPEVIDLGGDLRVIPAILDDVQLRIHTVMVITAYALMYLAAVISAVYLVGYYAVWFQRVFTDLAPLPVPAAANAAELNPQRPLMAGAAPGDDIRGTDLPQWLNNIDWSQLIVLNMVFVLMFVGGVILGAWWADYSWGRPWGWDPKEVFALNTWIVYAILIHVRFVVKRRGLWTAWLSIAGCAMMAFNWFFVNFFISSIHSYA